MSLLTGIGVLITFVYALWINRKKIIDKRLAISYMLFVLMSAGAAAFSRFSFGLDIAISARYLLLPLLFVIVLYTFILNEKHKPGQTSNVLSVCLFGLIFTMNTIKGLHQF
ncbi:MAG: hypothetical protein U5Q03_00905 [Bacteroidota bacterium]|nr:hypothetical protein [Bacteroidota bacterium]